MGYLEQAMRKVLRREAERIRDSLREQSWPSGYRGGTAWRESRVLSCGRCYSENGEETHSHPLCCYRKNTAELRLCRGPAADVVIVDDEREASDG